jgi:hypothetical protein
MASIDSALDSSLQGEVATSAFSAVTLADESHAMRESPARALQERLAKDIALLDDRSADRWPPLLRTAVMVAASALLWIAMAGGGLPLFA